MTDKGQVPAEDSQELETETIKKTVETKEEPEMFGREYVEELRKEAAENRVKLKTLQEADEERAKQQKAETEKQLKEQQKFEELANQYKADLDTTSQTAEQNKEQLERQTAVLEALYESRKGAVPEMYQPLLDKLDLVDRLQWIAENEAKLKPEKNGTPGIPHTPNPKGQGELTPEQRRAKAARTW